MCIRDSNDFVHNKGEVDESVNLKTLGWELKSVSHVDEVTCGT